MLKQNNFNEKLKNCNVSKNQSLTCIFNIQRQPKEECIVDEFGEEQTQ